MAEAEPDAETDAEPEPEDGERPPIAEDERAELDLGELARDLERERSGGDEDGDGDEPDTDEDGESGELVAGGDTWGDKYVALLALGLASVVRRYGELDVDDEVTDELGGELQAKAAEIMELATFGPLDLANDMNRLLDKHGGPTDIPPEAAVVLGTVALAVVVVATDTDLLADALGDLEVPA